MEKRKYNIGGVIVEIDNTTTQKFRVLRMAMDNWAKKNSNLPIDSPAGRQYNNDSDRYNKLKELFEWHKPNFIKSKHMIEVNEMFRRYNEKN